MANTRAVLLFRGSPARFAVRHHPFQKFYRAGTSYAGAARSSPYLESDIFAEIAKLRTSFPLCPFRVTSCSTASYHWVGSLFWHQAAAVVVGPLLRDEIQSQNPTETAPLGIPASPVARMKLWTPRMREDPA